MELQRIQDLLVRHLESGVLPPEEGEQLVTGVEQLIENNRFDQLEGTAYHKDGVSRKLSREELERLYWELLMYYDEGEGHDHDHELDHDHDEHPAGERSPWQQWGWLFILTALLLGVLYVLIKYLR
jgi:hypothetical protein